MGIPYSRQINAAFEQVTPLVAAGFKVLRTTRDISILLAVIQVLTVWFLFLILVALVAVLFCVNPDLEVCHPPLHYHLHILMKSGREKGTDYAVAEELGENHTVECDQDPGQLCGISGPRGMGHVAGVDGEKVGGGCGV